MIKLHERVSSVSYTLGSRLKTLQERKLLDEVAMDDNGSFIVYKHVGETTSEKSLLDSTTAIAVAEVLADTITNDIEPILVRSYFGNSYFRVNKEELERLFRDAITLLHRDDEASLYSYTERRNHILMSIHDYIMTNDYLDLLGFVRFRLKEYCLLLQDAIDRAIDDYLTEQEHEEFVLLLRNFVDIQEPQMGEVNVVLQEPGVFKLIDSQHNVIDNAYLEGFITDLLESTVDYDDLLVSALITIAPESIVLHYHTRYRAIDTIEGIFGHRVNTCKGCKLCSSFIQMLPDN